MLEQHLYVVVTGTTRNGRAGPGPLRVEERVALAVYGSPADDAHAENEVIRALTHVQMKLREEREATQS